MSKRIVIVLCLIAASVAPALAQSPRVEISGFGGWTASDGVSGNAVTAGDGNIYNRVDPKDSESYGLSIGLITGRNTEFGFIFGRQQSKLLLGGTNERTLGNLLVTTNHLYFGYTFGEPNAKLHPFFYLGFGSTRYGEVNVTVNGENRSLGEETQFSTTWGVGMKIFASQHFGFRVAGEWTPTYIKSDAGGMWCDPYWGCYAAGDPQYSHQLTFSGGVIGRF